MNLGHAYGRSYVLSLTFEVLLVFEELLWSPKFLQAGSPVTEPWPPYDDDDDLIYIFFCCLLFFCKLNFFFKTYGK